MNKLAVVTGTLCLSLAVTAPLQAKELFKARLTSDKVVEAPELIDTKASGKAFLRLNNKETSIEIQLHVRRGENIIAATLNCGAKDELGDPITFLAGPTTGHDVNGKWISKASFGDEDLGESGCGMTVPELAEAMRGGMTFVVVHSDMYPDGELRGQLKSTRK